MAMTFYQELDDLRARVAALEAKYETMRLATTALTTTQLEWGNDVENLKRRSVQHLLRIERLETGATCPHIVSSDEGTSYCDLARATSRNPKLIPRGSAAHPTHPHLIHDRPFPRRAGGAHRSSQGTLPA